MIKTNGFVERQTRKSSNSSTTMISIEIRFIALIVFTVISFYIIYDTQRTNTLSIQITRVRGF